VGDGIELLREKDTRPRPGEAGELCPAGTIPPKKRAGSDGGKLVAGTVGRMVAAGGGGGKSRF